MFVCAHDCRAVRAVQAALQTATAVVGSRELVSCGNRGTTCMMYLVVEWIPAAMRVHFAHWIISRVPLLRIVRFRWKSVVLPGRILISLGFSDLPRAPAPS